MNKISFILFFLIICILSGYTQSINFNANNFLKNKVNNDYTYDTIIYHNDVIAIGNIKNNYKIDLWYFIDSTSNIYKKCFYYKDSIFVNCSIYNLKTDILIKKNRYKIVGDNNILFGRVLTYDKNKVLLHKYFVKNSNYEGLFYLYYNNGNIKEVNQVFNHKNNGVSIQFFIDGNILSIGKYKGDLKINKWTFYYKTAFIKKEGRYKQIKVSIDEYLTYNRNDIDYKGSIPEKDTITISVKDSIWVYYSNEGNLIKKEYYDSGKLIELKEYNSEEKLIKDEKYKEGKLLHLIEYDNKGEIIKDEKYPPLPPEE